MTPLEQWSLLCWALWWIAWIVTWTWKKPARWEQPPQERMLYSLLLWVGLVLVLMSFGHHGGAMFARALPQRGGVVWLGFTLTLAGLLFAIWARLALGRNWSQSMDLKEGHELVTRGPYALVRHPIYSGLLLMFVGSILVAGTWLSIAGFALAIWSCLIRVRREDALMAKTFPDEYPAYARRVKRLVPWVY